MRQFQLWTADGQYRKNIYIVAQEQIVLPSANNYIEIAIVIARDLRTLFGMRKYKSNVISSHSSVQELFMRLPI